MTSTNRRGPRRPGRSRYEVTVDGQVAGFVAYEDRGHVRVFTHTEVDDRFEGRGLGSQPGPQALDDARSVGAGSSPSARSWPGTSSATPS